MFVVWWLLRFVSASGHSQNLGVRPGEDFKQAASTFHGLAPWEVWHSLPQLCWKGLRSGVGTKQPVKVSYKLDPSVPGLEESFGDRACRATRAFEICLSPASSSARNASLRVPFASGLSDI